MRIISPAKNQSGIEIIVKAMETNITNKDCCEEFCLFLDEMLEEPDIKGIFGKTIKFVQPRVANPLVETTKFSGLVF